MDSKAIITEYFISFNKGDLKSMLNLVAENVSHETNQGDVRTGRPLFEKFMNHMNQSYKETIKDIVLLTSTSDSHRISAEYFVDGEYLKTDNGLPEARNQKYSIRAGSFFEITQGKISRITTYYNLPLWIKLVQ